MKLKAGKIKLEACEYFFRYRVQFQSSIKTEQPTVSDPSVWHELIGPLHNPNLWVVALVFLGFPLIVYGRVRQEN